MSDALRDPSLTPLQRAALALREMRARLERAEEQAREPIAVAGIGCRFPGGASSAEAYWTLLREGRDTVRECPPERWDADRLYDPDADRPGTVATRHGSFLDGVDLFDAAHFGIPPSEAESLDPQQRILLEVAWEGFEHAGIAPDTLRGSRTGVFVGIGQNDYARRRLLSGDVERIGPYDGTGNGFCFAAGRLSHVFGLQGPNLAVDTACSASLVAVHLACQSLRLRECDLAIAGGVQLMLSPEVTIFLSRAHALSPDGRCRTFDAAANGYGRGEGCGLIVLKRLSDALRDGDRIYAVIRGSAVNHDGLSSGLTVPNAPAQRALIREALTRAGLQPDDIDYVEAHGTATPLGDPIELSGLEGVFAPRGAAEPLRIGSVKTNLGHLEAAAGIAGLIKVTLALDRGELPPHLHCETPNPRIDWERLPIRVARTLEPWPRGPRARRAGVSSFGISGTNAHVVLEEAPESATAGTRRAPLPPRAWQRQRYWIDLPQTPPRAARADLGHPFVHRRVSSPVRRPEIEFETTLEPGMPLVAGHRVHGTPVLPAAACLEMALAAARAAGGSPVSIETCAFHRALAVSRPIDVRIVLTPKEAGAFECEIHSDGADGWTHHASLRLSAASAAATDAMSIDMLLARLPQRRSAAEIYDSLQQRGVELGPSFRVLGEIAVGDSEALARIDGQADKALTVDPALVDGCSILHAVLQTESGTWVQTRLDSLELRGTLSAARWAHLQRASDGTGGTLTLLDASGFVLLRVVQHLRPIGPREIDAAGVPLPLYELTWVPRGSDRDADDEAWRAAEEDLNQFSIDIVQAVLRDGNRPGGDKHQRLLARMLEMLPSERALAAPSGRVDVMARARALAERHPIAATEFELLGRCGSRLADVLRGACNPLELLFPASGASAAALYSTSYAARVMNARLVEMVVAQATAVERRPLRILEIGAGTGATTTKVLERLGNDVEYWFTDVAPVFVEQGRARYHDDARVRFQTLDIEQPVEPQGFDANSFDIVIASNVLHATRSLRGTLANARALLREGGALVLLEGTSPRPWVDLIFGLTDGWWRFEDEDVRRAHPLLPPASWRALLEGAGFGEVEAWPSVQEGPAGQSLIVAVAGAAVDAPAIDSAASGKRAWLVTGGAAAAGVLAEELKKRGVSADVVQGSIADAIDAASGRVHRIVAVPLTPGGDDASSALAEAAHAARLVRDVVRSPQAAPLWFVTHRGTLAQAPVRGLARTLMLEAPATAAGIIAADDLSAPGVSAVVDALLAGEAGEEVSLRDGVPHVPRVVPLSIEAPAPPAVAGGTWLITGVLGAFGLATAEHLGPRGVTHLCLLGRHGAASAEARAAVTSLEQRGVAVTVVEADVADEARMREVIDAISHGPTPLRGVVHAAGVTGFSLLAELRDAEAEAILRPKIMGGWVLHTLTRDLPLDYFVCYSSMVSVWGARGQGPYVAANRFLDELAQQRHSLGLPAVTINWGPLSGGGMVPEAVANELRRMGVATTDMRDAVRVLDRVLGGGRAQTIAVDIDWTRFRELYGQRRSATMFELVDRQASRSVSPVSSAASSAPATAPLRDRVINADPAARRGLLLEQLRGIVARVVSAKGPIDSAAGLFDLGLDSLGAMELRRQLETAYGVALPSTLLFDSGTLEGLTDDMLSRLGCAVEAAAQASLSEEALEARLLEKLQELS